MAKILVVDDSKAISKILADALITQGHEPINCHSVDQAIAALEEHKTTINLVITDLIMPDRDGMELIDYIQTKIDAYDRPKLIVISGGSQSTVTAETAIQMVKGRVDKVMKKPFTKDDLKSAVETLLKP